MTATPTSMMEPALTPAARMPRRVTMMRRRRRMMGLVLTPPRGTRMRIAMDSVIRLRRNRHAHSPPATCLTTRMSVLPMVLSRRHRPGMRTLMGMVRVIRTRRRHPVRSLQVMSRWPGTIVRPTRTRPLLEPVGVAQRTRTPTPTAPRIATIRTTTMMAFWTGWTPLR